MDGLQYLDACEAAKRLAVCEETIRRLVHAGELKAIKFRRCLRVSVESLDEFVKVSEFKISE